MLNFLRKILKPKYDSLNKIVVRAASLIANYDYLKSLQPAAEIFPVLKANAYGHGLKEVCRILNRTKAPLVIVDSFPEAQVAYRYFKGKVLILGEMPLGAYRYCRFSRTEFVVYNSETLHYLSRFGKKAKVHLFHNSGMNREGIKGIGDFIATNKKYLDRVDITGFCSHLASADEEEAELNREQEADFMQALELLRRAGYFPRWVHLGNSASIFNLNNPLLTAYRPGLALYGYSPSAGEKGEKLEPALEVFSHIVAIQDLKAGETVSYSQSYQAKAATRIAVVPFGYFEGLDRRLSNRASFLVRPESEQFWAPVVGNICMNLCCLMVGYRDAKVGDIVKIISSRPSDPNSFLNLAKEIEAIPYELMVRLQGNIRREII